MSRWIGRCFRLLVGIERYGPIGVVDLADKAGRDYTTVSRQVTKLESLGLIERQPSEADRRINEAVITAKGQSVTDALDAARLRLATPLLAKWSEEDFSTLVRLLRRFVDDVYGRVLIRSESQLPSAVQPPSTGKLTPLIKPLSEPSARNAIALATSWGDANRAIGTRFTISASE